MVVTLCYMVTIPWTLAYSHAGLIVQHTVYRVLPLKASLEGRHFSTPKLWLFEERSPIQQLHEIMYLCCATGACVLLNWHWYIIREKSHSNVYVVPQVYILRKRSETRPGDCDFSTITIVKRLPFTIVNSISIPSKSACINIYHWWQWSRRWL